MDISYHHTPTKLGIAVVALSPFGVCFLQFGKSLTVLLHDMREMFPTDNLAEVSKREDPRIERVVRAIHAAIEGDDSVVQALPIASIGTEFQRKVWNHLRSIPSGEVRSYSEVARALHVPLATRAVANACGANSIALLIPCHRIIRTDGSLGGYRWGVEAKRNLLAAEGAKRPRGANHSYQGNSVTGDIPETT